MTTVSTPDKVHQWRKHQHHPCSAQQYPKTEVCCMGAHFLPPPWPHRWPSLALRAQHVGDSSEKKVVAFATLSLLREIPERQTYFVTFFAFANVAHQLFLEVLIIQFSMHLMHHGFPITLQQRRPRTEPRPHNSHRGRVFRHFSHSVSR